MHEEKPTIMRPTAAKNLLRGDVCGLHLYGEVQSVTPVTGSDLVTVRMALRSRDEGLRYTSRTVIEFTCKRSRGFRPTEGDGYDHRGVLRPRSRTHYDPHAGADDE
jgi:hypothetical protein